MKKLSLLLSLLPALAFGQAELPSGGGGTAAVTNNCDAPSVSCVAASMQSNGTLSVTGAATLSSTLNVIGAATFGSTVAATGNVTGANLSGTNTGDNPLVLGAAGSSPNANGLSLTQGASNQTLVMQPASASFAGSFSSSNFSKLAGLPSSFGVGTIGSGVSDGLAYSNGTYTLHLATGTTPGALDSTGFTKLAGLPSSFSVGSIGSGTANGLSYSAGVYTLHNATTTTPGAQTATNKQKTEVLTAERWIVPPNSTVNANTAITITAGRVYLRAVSVRFRGSAVGISIMTPQTGTLGGSAQVGIYGPITNSGTFTCAGAALVASSSDTSETTGTPVALGHGWTIAFSSATTIDPGIYCLAVQTNTGVLITRDSNFYNWEDGWNSRFTTDQSTGTTALPSTIPAVSIQGSDNPVIALKMN